MIDRDNYSKLRNPINPILQMITLAIVFVVGLTIVFGSWYTVDQTERGIILRNGAVHGVAQPGLNFKLPWIDSVHNISLQSNRIPFTRFEAYSSDQQPATLALSVNYHIDPSKVEEVYIQYRGEEGLANRVVIPQVYNQIKTVFGQYTALRSIQDRGKFTMDSESALREVVKGSPIVIESVQIENIDFSDSYEQSIEQRMLAEIEVQKRQQNLAMERVQADITVTRAKAEADSNITRAKAEAQSIIVRGEAEAKTIKLRAEALALNSNLVELTKAEKWNGVLPTTMPPLGTVPILGVGGSKDSYK